MADQARRIASLRTFVASLARADDREGTAAALVDLARAAPGEELAAAAPHRAGQALHLYRDQDADEPNVRALLELAAVCLEIGELETAEAAAALAGERRSEERRV